MSSTHVPGRKANAASEGSRPGGEPLQGFRGRMHACERALARPWVQWAAVVLGLLGAVAVGIAALVVGPLPWNHPQTWWFDLPLNSMPVPQRIDALNKVFYAGLATMTAAWLVVGIGVRAGRWRQHWLWGLGLLWAVPWLIAPVAMSTDIYTYLAQGFVADAGLNPYTNGPAAADLPAVLRDRMSPVWLETPSPYGPAFVGITQLLAPLATEHIVRAVVLLRLVEFAGIALAAVCVPRVARHAGASPNVATWLGVVSPLMLASGVLSGHNDALMVGLVIAALALATRGTWPALLGAVGIATVATLVKAPAAAAVVVLALGWMRRAPSFRAGIARFGGSVFAVAATAALVSVASGLGTSWLTLSSFATPLTGSPPFTPTDAVSTTISRAADLLGVQLSASTILPVIRRIGEVLAVVFALLVLWRQPRLGDTRTIGLIMAAAVLGSPTVWPWYVIWPALLMAASPAGARTRLAWVVVVAASPFLVRSDGGPGLLGPVAVAVVAVCAVAALVAASVFAWRTLIKGREPVGPTAKDERPAA